MNSYVRDDGVEMVETRPGCFTRRDSLGLLDLAPLRRRAEAPPLAPTHEDIAPEPDAPPPLQPSFADLVSEGSPDILTVSPPCTHHSVAGCGGPTAEPSPAPASRAARPKPARRSLAAILAEADRTHRVRRAKARA